MTQTNIIFLQLNEFADERLAVGLVMRDEKRVLAAYARDKLKLGKKILGDDSIKTAEKILQSIQNEIDAYRAAQLPFQEYCNDLERFINSRITHRGSLIYFGETRPLARALTQEVFAKMFAAVINARPQRNVATLEKLEDLFEQSLAKRITPHVTLQYEFSREQFPGLELLSKVRAKFAGKNDCIVTGNMIDFANVERAAAENKLMRYMKLSDALRQQRAAQSPPRCFLLARKPLKDSPEPVRRLWNDVRDVNWLTVLPENEWETVAEYVEEHGVRPL